MNLLEEMAKAVIEGDEEEAVSLAKKGLSMGIDPTEAIEKGFGEGMREVGRLFDKLEIFLPQVILSADAIGPQGCG